VSKKRSTKDNDSVSKEEKIFFFCINDIEYTFDVNDTLSYTDFFINDQFFFSCLLYENYMKRKFRET